MLKEFKEFAMKGNVVDMAIGIIIGAAFGQIVASMVNDVLMPPIGLIAGGDAFAKLKVVLKPAALDEAGKVADMVHAFGRALPGQLVVLAVEGRQAQLLEMVLQQDLRGIGHAAVPDISTL